MEYYSYVKSLHIIFVVTWFSALFYIPRLYIYLIEAQELSQEKKDLLSSQFLLMIRRLWVIIAWPSAILAIGFGVLLLAITPNWIKQPWMHTKLLFVLILLIYHIKSYKMYKRFSKHKYKYSSTFMRFWNEGATILLFVIVFLAVLKNTFGWVFGLLGIVCLGLVLTFGIKLYKKLQNKN